MFSAANLSCKKQVAVVYLMFLASTSAVCFFVADMEFSSTITVAGLAQCLSAVFLAMQSLAGSRGCGSSKARTGVSARTLAFQILGLAFRLSATMNFQGYLPVDASGDRLYQAVDGFTLFLSVVLLLQVLCRRAPCNGLHERHSCKPLRELAHVVLVTLGCILLGSLLHADTDKAPLYDSAWMAGMFLLSAALISQFSTASALASKRHTAAAPTATFASHSVLAGAMAQLLGATFIWHARSDVECTEFFEGFNHSVWAVLAAHVIPLLMVCDFSPDYTTENADD